MSFSNVISLVSLALVIGLASYVFLGKTEKKKGFVLNQQIFEKFNGKKAMEERLNTFRAAAKADLDSISTQINANPKNEKLQQLYAQRLKQVQLKEEELSQTYTADIWKRINGYIDAYGKEKNYEYIFGAMGNGGIMYADEAQNITDEVIEYINKKYEGE